MKSYIILLSLIISACTSNDSEEQRAMIDTNRFIQCWTHSMEEDPDSNTQVFRPCDYKEFPVTRFRMTMTLKSDGSAEYLELSPLDAHSMVAGRWTFDDSNNEFQLLSDKEAPVLKATTSALQGDMMSLRIN